MQLEPRGNEGSWSTESEAGEKVAVVQEEGDQRVHVIVRVRYAKLTAASVGMGWMVQRAVWVGTAMFAL